MDTDFGCWLNSLLSWWRLGSSKTQASHWSGRIAHPKPLTDTAGVGALILGIAQIDNGMFRRGFVSVMQPSTKTETQSQNKDNYGGGKGNQEDGLAL